MEMVGGRWVASWWNSVVLLNRAVTLEILLMGWSVAWLVLVLRQPRPRLRRLARQPGFVAVFASAFVVLLSGPLTAYVVAYWRGAAMTQGYWIQIESWIAVVSSQIGVAIGTGWALLVLGRACRVRSGWMDGVGQVFGIVWIVMIPGNLILLFWELLP